MSLSALDDHPCPRSVRRGFAHAAIAAEHRWGILAENHPGLIHLVDFRAVDRMDDRDLIRMDRGFGEQTVFDVLLDFGPEDVGRREVLENGSGSRKKIGRASCRERVCQYV